MRQPLRKEKLRYAEADRLHLAANWAIRAGWRLTVGNRKILILCLAPKEPGSFPSRAAEGSWASGGVRMQGCGLPN
jgi:hypothetical protein